MIVFETRARGFDINRAEWSKARRGEVREGAAERHITLAIPGIDYSQDMQEGNVLQPFERLRSLLSLKLLWPPTMFDLESLWECLHPRQIFI
jgi:hypothetical protein